MNYSAKHVQIVQQGISAYDIYWTLPQCKTWVIEQINFEKDSI